MKNRTSDINTQTWFQNPNKTLGFIFHVLGIKNNKEISLLATDPLFQLELRNEIRKLYKTKWTYMINYNTTSFSVQDLLRTHAKIITKSKSTPDNQKILANEFIKNVVIPRATSFIPPLFYNDKELMKRMISGENLFSTEFDRFREMTDIDPVKMAYPKNTGNDKDQKDKISKWKNGICNPTPGSIVQFIKDLETKNEIVIKNNEVNNLHENHLSISDIPFLKERLIIYATYNRATREISNEHRKEILKKSMLFYKMFMKNEGKYQDLSRQLIERYTQKFMKTLEKTNQQAEERKSTNIRSDQFPLKPFKDPSTPPQLEKTLGLCLERIENNQYETWKERMQDLKRSILISCFLFQTKKRRPKSRATLNLIKKLMKDLEKMTSGSFRVVMHEDQYKDEERYGLFGLNDFDLTDDQYFQEEYLTRYTIPRTAARYLLFFGGDEHFDVPYIKCSKINSVIFNLSCTEKYLWNDPRSMEGLIRECTTDSSFLHYES